MITFTCQKCGRSYSVGDVNAGRQAKCNKCGTLMTIPTTNTRNENKIVISFESPAAAVGETARNAIPPSAPTAAPHSTAAKASSGSTHKLSPRTRRLLADAEEVGSAFRNFAPIRVRSIQGDPPDCYQIEYHIGGLARGADGKPVFRDDHLLEIQLTSEYPRSPPKCRMLSPIFHPNFEPATVCVGDHWTAAERLVDLIVRIAEMIAYQAYNNKSPLDGEAAMWADHNARQLPIDRRDLTPPTTD